MSIVGEVPSDPHPATLPETIFSDRARRDQRRSVAVANRDEAADDADISGLLVRAEIDP